MRIDIITLFPEMLTGFLESSMMARAVKLGAVEFNLVNPRDFTEDKHHTTDDRPFGGGPGMVMKPEPLYAAVASVRTENSRIIYLSPQGKPFQQGEAETLAREDHLVLLCGHYEGIDQRIIDLLVTDELSIGDYVLTQGALPAAVVADAVVRLIPGVVGGPGATEAESFSSGVLDYPHYTRPAEFKGLPVPEVLLSGDHQAVAKWRETKAREKTLKIRPDLLKKSEDPGK